MLLILVLNNNQMLDMQTLFEYVVYISEVVGNTAKSVNRTYKVLLYTFFFFLSSCCLTLGADYIRHRFVG